MPQFFDRNSVGDGGLSASVSGSGDQLPLPFDPRGSSEFVEGRFEQYILVQMSCYGSTRDVSRLVSKVEKELRLQFGSMVRMVVPVVMADPEPAPTVDVAPFIWGDDQYLSGL